MSVNKVVYGNRTLIDLTGDTVTEETLIKGCKAQGTDGTIIVGTRLSGCLAEFFLEEEISDSSEWDVQDETGTVIKGRIKYPIQISMYEDKIYIWNDGEMPEYNICASGIMVFCKACDRYLELLRVNEHHDQNGYDVVMIRLNVKDTKIY